MADLAASNVTLDGGGNATNITYLAGGNRTASRDQFEFYQTEQIAFLVVILVLIIFGNVSVLVAIAVSKQGRRSRMNYFIMHLAIADLSTGLISVLTDLVWRITVQWYAGDVMCRLVRFLQAVVTYASTYVLVSLSVDRLDAIARPLSFRGSNSRARVLIGLAWFFAALFSSPMLLINGIIVTPNGATQCHIGVLNRRWHWQLYMTLIALALFVLPALIISACYAAMIYIIWSKMKNVESKELRPVRRSFKSSTRSSSNGRAAKAGAEETQLCDDKDSSATSSRGVIPAARIRTVKMTFVIVLVFILCWSPYFVYDLLDVYGFIPRSQFKLSLSIFIQSLAPLNSVFNPLIYGLFSSRICQNLRRVPACDWLLSRFCCCACADAVATSSRSLHMSGYSHTTYVSVAEERRRSTTVM